MTPAKLSKIVAWFHPTRGKSLSTWVGETKDCIAVVRGQDIDPMRLANLKLNHESAISLKDTSTELFDIDQNLTYEQKLELTKTVDGIGYLVVVFK